MPTTDLGAAAERIIMRHFHEDEPSPLDQPEEDDDIRDDCLAVAEGWRVANAEVERLQRFKDYVHGRLDAAGVPADPDSPHKAKGCRIGGRLDWVLEHLSPSERTIFAEMIDRVGVVHSTREDAPGVSVQLEHDDAEGVTTDWHFNGDGKLVAVLADIT